jgi:hypothetical protein
MENNKNPFSLKENADPIKHLSLDSLVAKTLDSNYSSPNYAQDLIDYINTESKTNSSRATFFQPILDNATTFSPAPSTQKGLFVTNQEVLSRNAWKLLLEVSNE